MVQSCWSIFAVTLASCFSFGNSHTLESRHRNLLRSEHNVGTVPGLITRGAANGSVWAKCHEAEWALAPRVHKHPRIAVVLRGETFRNGNKDTTFDMPEAGIVNPFKRITCANGSLKLQNKSATVHLREIQQLENLGYTVDLFGVTYPCTAGSELGRTTVDRTLKRIYGRKFQTLRLLDKNGSSQITGIYEGFNLAVDHMRAAGTSYEHVLIGRWENPLGIDAYACRLKKNLKMAQDASTIGDFRFNADQYFVIPGQFIPCFEVFLRETTVEGSKAKDACCAVTGCGGCNGCIRKFAQIVYGYQHSSELHPCNKDLLRQPPHANRRLPEWLGSYDRNCIKKRIK